MASEDSIVLSMMFRMANAPRWLESASTTVLQASQGSALTTVDFRLKTNSLSITFFVILFIFSWIECREGFIFEEL